MIEIKELPEFSEWLRSIRDGTTRLRLLARLRKVTLGNLGDVAKAIALAAKLDE